MPAPSTTCPLPIIQPENTLQNELAVAIQERDRFLKREAELTQQLEDSMSKTVSFIPMIYVAYFWTVVFSALFSFRIYISSN